jgi:hypothetical protein
MKLIKSSININQLDFIKHKKSIHVQIYQYHRDGVEQRAKIVFFYCLQTRHWITNSKVLRIIMNYTIDCLMWCPGQNKRIAPPSFLHGCLKRRLKD